MVLHLSPERKKCMGHQLDSEIRLHGSLETETVGNTENDCWWRAGDGGGVGRRAGAVKRPSGGHSKALRDSRTLAHHPRRSHNEKSVCIW